MQKIPAYKKTSKNKNDVENMPKVKCKGTWRTEGKDRKNYGKDVKPYEKQMRQNESPKSDKRISTTNTSHLYDKIRRH